MWKPGRKVGDWRDNVFLVIVAVVVILTVGGVGVWLTYAE